MKITHVGFTGTLMLHPDTPGEEKFIEQIVKVCETGGVLIAKVAGSDIQDEFHVPTKIKLAQETVHES